MKPLRLTRALPCAALLGLCASPIHPASDTVFYVSPGGSDANPGTLAAPFATIAHAQAAARGAKDAAQGPIVVNLRGGTYRLAAPLQFTATDSGSPGEPIVYQAFGFGTPQQETPIVSGGQVLDGIWTLHDPTVNIWRVPVPAGLQTRQLYVDGQRATRAVQSEGLPLLTKVDGVGYTTTDPSVCAWSNPEDVEFVYTGTGRKWRECRCGVQAVVGCGGTGTYTIEMDQPGFTQGTGSVELGAAPNIGHPTAIENAYEFLDAPGEWYHDRGQDLLYYIPLPDQSMAAAEVVVPVLEELLHAAGDPQDPVRHLAFRGIRFLHATWLLPSTGEGMIAGQANNLYLGPLPPQRLPTPGAVTFRYAHDVLVERCRFQHLGAEGLVFELDAENNQIIGNVITDVSGAGLRIGRPADDPPPPQEFNVGNAVENNYMHHVAVEYRGGVALQVVFAKDTVLRHNEIGYTPYTGLSFGWGWEKTPNPTAENNAITHNRIHHVMQVLQDGAAIYTLNDQGSTPTNRSIVSNNYLHDQAFSGTSNAPLYFDQSSSFIHADSNVLENLAGHYSVFVWCGSACSSMGTCAQASYVTNIDVTNTYSETAGYVNNAVCENVHVGIPILKPWPPAAQGIIDAAGLEPQYQDLLTEP